MISSKLPKRIRPRLPDPSSIAGWLLLAALLFAAPAWGKELRRSMSFIRPWLMGDAYVAVADESSTLFYNPAGIAALKEGSAEIFNFQLNGDRRVKTAILDPDALGAEFQGVDETNLQSRVGETAYVSLNMRLPSIVQTDSGWAYGLGLETLAYLEVLDNELLPGLRLEFFFDKVFFITKSYRVGDNFFIGFTPKLISRIGLDRSYDFAELFLNGSTVDVTSDTAYEDVQNGRTFEALGLDLGFLYRVPAWEGWNPRLGVSFLNIGGRQSQHLVRGMEFGDRTATFDVPQAGELPQLNTIGFAVSPIAAGIRYTISLDIVDFTRTALPGEGWEMRSRLGFELGLGPKKDGTTIFSLLAGLNAGHFSSGILARVWVFEVGFGSYTVELGEKAGDNPDRRYVFLFGVRI